MQHAIQLVIIVRALHKQLNVISVTYLIIKTTMIDSVISTLHRMVIIGIFVKIINIIKILLVIILYNLKIDYANLAILNVLNVLVL